MANRQTYVIGALGVLVGMVVGANSAQRADLVSYAGHNPNSQVIQDMPNLRRASGIFRTRSEQETLDVRSGVAARWTAPRRSSLGDNVDRRRGLRLSQDIVHFSAPNHAGTVRGAPAQRRHRVPGCTQYSGQRYTHCLESYLMGEEYVPNYFPTNY